MNKKTRKLFTWCLVVALIVTQMLFANVAFAATSLKGSDRYQTALEVVKAGWTTSENAVIARGDDLADALAAAPLAYAKGKAPILLTETAALPAGVLDELTALGVKNVYIVGGTGAVSAAVEAQLAAKFTVKRLWGADRAATALEVAKEAFPTAPAKAVLVNGYAVADALSISAIAAYNGMPILLAEKDSVAADVATYLAGKTVYAVGGTGVLSDAVVGTATRLYGADRYATNVAVLKAFTLDYSKVFVAVGEDANSVDALGGAAFAALGNNPIVLVNNALTAEASALLKANLKADGKVYTLGGVVPASVAAAVESLIPVPTELKVESVSANNLKEVVINFNKAVDETEAAKTANYAVTGKTVTLATVAADKKSVVLTLDTKVNQQAEVEVTAKKALGLADDVTVKTTAIDVTIPTADSIKLTGPNTFEVTFSEPVQAGTPEVLINNGVYGVTSANLSTSGRVLTVTLSASSLTAGDYSVKISGYKDYADFAAMAKTFTLSYAKDTSAPTATLKSATQTEVKVVFNKAVTKKGGAVLDENYFYQTYSAWKPYSVTTTDNKTFTLSFVDSDPSTVDPILPEGNVTITVLKSVGEVPVVDVWGNEMAADAKLVASIVIDKTAPTVTKVEATAEDTLEVTFSEDVNTLTAANFAIKGSDGKAVSQTITDIDYDAEDYVATLTLSAKLSGGAYTVEVKDVTDKALTANKIAAVTVAFTVTDKTAIDLTAVNSVVVTNAAAKEQYVYVSFPEAVATTGANSALDKNNYLVGGTKLTDKDKVELFGTDGKRVKITVAFRGTTPAEVITGGTTTLTVGRIADLAGNVPTLISYTKVIGNDSAPTTFTAKAIGLNKIVLTFPGELKTVPADGIKVDNNGGDIDAASTMAAIDSVEIKTNTDGSKSTVVTATIKADDKLADKTPEKLALLRVYVVDDKLETITGQKLTSCVIDGSVADGIRPALDATTPITAESGKVTLHFDEIVATIDNGLAASDLVIVDKDGNSLVAGVDYTVSADTNTIVITLSGDYATYSGKLTVSTKTAVTYIVDGASPANKAVEFANKEVTIP